MNKYTTPQVSTKDPKDWYVWFRYEGAKAPIKKRAGINRIKDLKERQQEADALCEALLSWLEAGWNPVADPDYKQRYAPKENKYQGMGFREAMLFALEQKKMTLASTSKKSYVNDLNRILAIADKTLHSYIPVREFRRANVLELLSQCKTQYQQSNHGYNKYRDLIRGMFSVLTEWEIVANHPAMRIKDLKTVESGKFESLTDEEKRIVFDHLRLHIPNFLPYVLMLYYTGIRPKELLSLRISDIHLKRQLIIIKPDIVNENSKTPTIRMIPINDHLAAIITAMNLESYRPDYFVFGSNYGPTGHRGAHKSNKRGAYHPEFFKPSPFKIKRDTVTKLWKTVVMDFLKVMKHLYALKHTGADDMILADISLDALKGMYGHSSFLTTEIYAKKVKERRRSEIIAKAPSFLAPIQQVGLLKTKEGM